MTSAQINAVRTAIASNSSFPLPIRNAIVTYLKPLVPLAGSTDPAGFFIQAEQSGPALFIAVDPSSPSPMLSVGDFVSFDVQSGTQSRGMTFVTGITNLQRLGSGAPVASLVTDVSNVNLDGNAVGAYESRLVRITGAAPTNAFSTAGGGHVQLGLDTNGIAFDGGATPRLRLPVGVNQTVDLVSGCRLTATGPMWRNDLEPQPSIYAPSDLSMVDCPAPFILTGYAIDPVNLRVVFTRAISGLNNNSFTVSVDAGAPVTIVSVSAGPTRRDATLATSGVDGGRQVVISPSPALTDYFGKPIDAGTTVQLSGAACTTQPVVISQVYTSGGLNGSVYDRDYVELHNRTNATVQLNGWSLQYSVQNPGNTWNVVPLSGSIPAGGYLLVGGAATAGNGAALTPAIDGGFNFSSSVVVALRSITSALMNCPNAANSPGLVDVLGISGNCGATSATTGNTNVIVATYRRDISGPLRACQDTGVNINNFTAAVASVATSPNVCLCP